MSHTPASEMTMQVRERVDRQLLKRRDAAFLLAGLFFFSEYGVWCCVPWCPFTSLLSSFHPLKDVVLPRVLLRTSLHGARRFSCTYSKREKKKKNLFPFCARCSFFSCFRCSLPFFFFPPCARMHACVSPFLVFASLKNREEKKKTNKQTTTERDKSFFFLRLLSWECQGQNASLCFRASLLKWCSTPRQAFFFF